MLIRGSGVLHVKKYHQAAINCTHTPEDFIFEFITGIRYLFPQRHGKFPFDL
jgi:hypothetical protein